MGGTHGKDVRILSAYEGTIGGIEIFVNGTSRGTSNGNPANNSVFTIAGRYDPSSGQQFPNPYTGGVLNPFTGIGSIKLNAGDVVGYKSTQRTTIAISPFGVHPIFGTR